MKGKWSCKWLQNLTGKKRKEVPLADDDVIDSVLLKNFFQYEKEQEKPVTVPFVATEKEKNEI